MTSMAHAVFFAQVANHKPAVAIVLGSGLGQVVDRLESLAEVGFADLPGFAAPTVHGHRGRLVLARWHGQPILVFVGRMHYYEGHPWERVTQSVRLIHELGVRTLILTNAAGGIRDDLNPGVLMAITDHLPLLRPSDWQAQANRQGAANPSPYSASLVEQLRSAGVRTGVYAGVTGPCYETPAEIRAFRAMGADAVGMSTIREAEAAAERGIAVVGVSCITNKAAGLSPGAILSHTEVQDVASRGDVVEELKAALTGIIVTSAS